MIKRKNIALLSALLSTSVAIAAPNISAGSDPYFNGADFSLVDAAFAPGWMRLNLLEGKYKLGLFEKVPKVKRWSDLLLNMPSVEKSVVDDFEELFWRILEERGSYLEK